MEENQENDNANEAKQDTEIKVKREKSLSMPPLLSVSASPVPNNNQSAIFAALSLGSDDEQAELQDTKVEANVANVATNNAGTDNDNDINTNTLSSSPQQNSADPAEIWQEFRRCAWYPSNLPEDEGMF